MTDKRFISSYQGSATYRIDGKQYECRTFAYDVHPFRPEVYAAEIVPMIGCVWSNDDHGVFPAPEIMIHFPGYIAARYVRNPNGDYTYASTVEYAGGTAPQVRRDDRIGAVEVIPVTEPTTAIVGDNGLLYLPEPYEIIDAPLWWHLKGLSETASGYGRRLNSGRIVKLPDGRTRRIYVTIFSNIGTAWIMLDGKRVIVRG